MVALERTTDAFKRYGVKHAFGYKLISGGRFPPPVAKLEKPSRVPTNEVDEVIKLKIAGGSDEDIRKLVAELLASRKELIES